MKTAAATARVPGPRLVLMRHGRPSVELPLDRAQWTALMSALLATVVASVSAGWAARAQLDPSAPTRASVAHLPDPAAKAVERVAAAVGLPTARQPREAAVAPRPTRFGPPAPSPQEVARRLGLGTNMAASKLIHGWAEDRWVAAAGPASQAPRSLRWPVEHGWFVRGYGAGEGGYHLATDIAGEIGWDVHASADGIVGYADDGINGFGNLVLLIHPGGWITMYAHNSINLVDAGERVRAGQVIAQVGSTGISRGPHVHYELIYAGRNCDALPLFRPAVLHRGDRPADVPPATWRAGLEDRPTAIKCAPRRRHPRSRHHHGNEVAANVDPEADAEIEVAEAAGTGHEEGEHSTPTVEHDATENTEAASVTRAEAAPQADADEASEPVADAADDDA